MKIHRLILKNTIKQQHPKQTGNKYILVQNGNYNYSLLVQ